MDINQLAGVQTTEDGDRIIPPVYFWQCPFEDLKEKGIGVTWFLNCGEVLNRGDLWSIDINSREGVDRWVVPTRLSFIFSHLYEKGDRDRLTAIREALDL